MFTDEQISAAMKAAGCRKEEAIQAMIECREQLVLMGFESATQWANLMGQCSHESAGFSRTKESLSYSAERLTQVWPSRFPTLEDAEPYARNSVALAGKVYGCRKDLGNETVEDGGMFLGRGYLQLTGRANYTKYAELLDIDMVENPNLAEEPVNGIMIAASFFANNSRGGKTLLEWADTTDHRTITKIINGGHHGLAEREEHFQKAYAALTGEAAPEADVSESLPRLMRRGDQGPTVEYVQKKLVELGFDTNGVDGIFGGGMFDAVRLLQAENGLQDDGIVGKDTYAAMGIEI